MNAIVRIGPRGAVEAIEKLFALKKAGGAVFTDAKYVLN
jgi:hypothetical protein